MDQPKAQRASHRRGSTRTSPDAPVAEQRGPRAAVDDLVATLAAPPDQVEALDRSLGAVRAAAALQLDARGPVGARADLHAGAQTASALAVASEGVAGAGARLPHAERIQQAFGRHTIDDVQAHVGGRAGAAADRLGANGYATGSAVAFAREPDLRLAAHEAAHVIQQRAGVNLSGGVGEVGDRYERHADEVADAVVRGQSAEAILDRMAGSGSSGATAASAVQLDGPGDRRAGAAGRESPERRRSSVEQLIEQLNDPALWSDPARSSNLQSLLMLAAAQGSAGAAYSIAIRMRALETHREVLVRAGVIDANGRVADPRPEAAAGPDLGARLSGGLYALDRGADLAGRAESSPEHYNLSNTRIDRVLDAAALAGSWGEGGRVPLRMSRLDAAQERAHINTLSVEVHNDAEGGRLNLTIPGLAIEQIHMSSGAARVRARSLTTGAVRIQATWPNARNPRAVLGMSINLQSFALEHLSYLGGSSTVGARRIAFDSLVVRAQDVPSSVRDVRSIEGAAGALRESLIEGPIARFFASPIVGQLLESAEAALGAVHRAGDLGETLPGGLSVDLRGLVIEGLATPGGAHAERVEVGHLHVATEHLRGPVTRMRIEQLQTRVREATDRLTALNATPSTDAVEVHERERLESQRTSMRSEITRLEGELPALDREDERYLALFRRQQPGGSPVLTAEERAELQRLQATRTARASFDVDRMVATGVGMRSGEDDGRISVTGVHGSMAVDGAMANPFPGTRPAVERPGARTSGGPVDAELSIERIRASNLRLGLPDYRGQAEQKATLERRAAEPGAAPSEADRQTLDGLRALWARSVPGVSGRPTYGAIVERLVAIEARGDDALRRDWAAQSERERLRHAIAEYGTRVDLVDVRGLALEARGTSASVDAGGTSGRGFAGEVRGSVGELDVQGVRSGPEAGVRRVTATGVRGDASLLMTTTARTDLWGRTLESSRTGTLSHGSLEVDALRVEGVRGEGGSSIGRVEADGLRVDGSTERDDGTIGITLRRLAAFEVRVPPRLAQLEAEATRLGAVTSPTADQTARLASLRERIATLRALPGRAAAQRETIERLQAEQRTARTRARRAEIARAIANETRALEELEAQLRETEGVRSTGDGPVLSVEGVSARARGLGDFVSDHGTLVGRDVDVELGLDDLRLGAFGVTTSEREMRIASGHVTGFRVGVSLHIGRAEGAESGMRIAPRRLTMLRIASLGARELRLRFPSSAGEVDLRLPEATIEGVEAANLPLDGIASFLHPTRDGHFQIAHAHATLRASVGDYLRARAEVTVAENLRFGMTRAGELSLDPGNLTIEAGMEAGSRLPPGTDPGSLLARIRGAGGSLHIRNVRTAARLDTATGRVTASGPIGEIGVSRVHFTTGGANMRIGEASMQSIDVEAVIDTDPAVLAARARGEEGTAPLVRSVVLRRFDIARIVGRDLHYDDGTTRVDLARGSLGGIRVADFNPRTESFRLAAGRGRGRSAVEIDGLQIVRAGLGELRDVTARVSSLTVTRANDGTLEAAVRGVTADARVRGAADGMEGGGRVRLGSTSASVRMDSAGNVTTTATLGDIGVRGLELGDASSLHVLLQQAQIRGVRATLRTHTPPRTERVARTVTHDLDLSIASVGITNGRFRIDDVDIELPGDASIRGLYANNIHVEIQESAPDAAGARRSTTTVLSGMAGVAGLSTGDASVVVPGLLSGQGSLTAQNLRVDILSRANQDFTLDQLRLGRSSARVQRVWRVSGVTVGASAEAEGIAGRIRGRDVDAEIDTARVGLDSSRTGGRLGARDAAARSGSRTTLDLDALDTLEGSLAIQLWDGIVVPVPFVRGHIAFDPSSWSLPSMPRLPGPLGAAQERLGRTRLVQAVRGFLRDLVNRLDQALRVRQRIERAIIDIIDGPTERADESDLASTLTSAMQSSTAAAAFAEMFTPQGEGITGLARTWIEQQIMGRIDPVVARSMARVEADRRADALRDWLGRIRIDGRLASNGPFSGEHLNAARESTTFRGQLAVRLGINGSLGTQLETTLGLSGANIAVRSGDTSVRIAGADADAGVAAGDRGGSLRGSADAGVRLRGVRVRTRLPESRSP
ncbi:MAG: DUF4157 domain-containing protein [Deltaproteobacteria bacterium]|nr:DUF4157 domain-containing protein [Deltaproteobacteria bacterium]